MQVAEFQYARHGSGEGAESGLRAVCRRVVQRAQRQTPRARIGLIVFHACSGYVMRVLVRRGGGRVGGAVG